MSDHTTADPTPDTFRRMDAFAHYDKISGNDVVEVSKAAIVADVLVNEAMAAERARITDRLRSIVDSPALYDYVHGLIDDLDGRAGGSDV